MLRKHLLTPAYETNITIYTEYVETTMKNSGQWLFAENSFDQWLNRKAALLSVSGGPGMGKSCLASVAITKLITVYPQDADHPNRTSVAYFFVKENDQALQTISNMLKTLAYQIADVDPLFRSHAIATVSTPDKSTTTRQLWDNLFLSFFQSRDLQNAAMIVLDGLDELPRAALKELFLLLEDIADAGNTEPRLSFCLLFRPEVQEYFGPKLTETIHRITAESKTEKDIQEYIKEHLKKVLVINQTFTLKSPRAAAVLGKHIRDRIVSKADGIFFKVVLILKDIEDKERVPAVLEAIEQTPPALDKMIEHVFEKLLMNEDVNKDDLQEVLLWVSFAKRPLAVAELYYILKSRTGNAYDALESRLRGRFASIFNLVASSHLQELQQSEAKDNPKVPRVQEIHIDIDDPSLEDFGDDLADSFETELDQIVKATENEEDGLNDETVQRFNETTTRFLHASIRDFLVKSPKDDAPVVISVDASLADAHIASVCIARLLDDDRSAKKCDILRYSTLYLTNHVMSIDFTALADDSKTRVFDLVFRLFQQDGMLSLLAKMNEADNGSGLKLIQDLFQTTTLTDFLQTNWFANMELDDCPTEQREWVELSRTSRVELLRPVALNACKLWLTKKGHDDPAYLDDDFQMLLVWIVHYFLRLVICSRPRKE
jgi:Cdc6-like AAA superfamily ATPase